MWCFVGWLGHRRPNMRRRIDLGGGELPRLWRRVALPLLFCLGCTYILSIVVIIVVFVFVRSFSFSSVRMSFPEPERLLCESFNLSIITLYSAEAHTCTTCIGPMLFF